jgi:hypothetical protein
VSHGINSVPAVQSLQSVPKVGVNVRQVVVNISGDRVVIFYITRREYHPVILERKIGETLMVAFPGLVLVCYKNLNTSV